MNSDLIFAFTMHQARLDELLRQAEAYRLGRRTRRVRGVRRVGGARRVGGVRRVGGTRRALLGRVLPATGGGSPRCPETKSSGRGVSQI